MKLAEPKLAKPAKAGGARRDRTADLLHAMQALSQLSYGPVYLRATALDQIAITLDFEHDHSARSEGAFGSRSPTHLGRRAGKKS
jgi:hypothetical protein